MAEINHRKLLDLELKSAELKARKELLEEMITAQERTFMSCLDAIGRPRSAVTVPHTMRDFSHRVNNDLTGVYQELLETNPGAAVFPMVEQAYKAKTRRDEMREMLAETIHQLGSTNGLVGNLRHYARSIGAY